MGDVVLTASVALGAIFALAGLTKVGDLERSKAAVKDFGVPAGAAGGVGVALPIAEVAIALLLLAGTSRVLGAAAALALLVAFCGAVGIALARGKRPLCNCFGQLHSAPIGWKTLARNGVLMALALFIVVAGRDDPGPSALAWTSRVGARDWAMLALTAFVLAALALAALAAVHILRAHGRVLVRLERVEERLRAAGFELDEPEDMPELGLAPGSEAPAFSLDSLDSGRVDLDALLEPGRPLLLLFTSPTCGPCSVLMPRVAEWQQEHADELTVALLSAGDADAVRAEASAHGLVKVLLDPELAMYEAYEANGTPSAVLVGADGTIASWLAAGSDWIESLVEQTVHGASTAGLPIGSELPATRLATLDGTEITLTDAIAEPTVLLFWNPGCGFCRSLHDDLTGWEKALPAKGPALIVVSAGEAEEVRSEGFASQVLLDPDWSVSSALGADGTPMAVLVDANGRIASPVVGGGPAVLELLGVGDLSPVR